MSIRIWICLRPERGGHGLERHNEQEADLPPKYNSFLFTLAGPRSTESPRAIIGCIHNLWCRPLLLNLFLRKHEDILSAFTTIGTIPAANLLLSLSR
eukprot:1161323-Pelagomonas_calceolata.AAC.2